VNAKVRHFSTLKVGLNYHAPKKESRKEDAVRSKRSGDGKKESGKNPLLARARKHAFCSILEVT
jgi:hypothetical protein